MHFPSNYTIFSPSHSCETGPLSFSIVDLLAEDNTVLEYGGEVQLVLDLPTLYLQLPEHGDRHIVLA